MKALKKNTVSHPFETAPHRTLFALSLPLLLSLVAEPLTGLADTAFVARLGSADLAAVGVGATALSSLFWTFSFLGVGTQTRIATEIGRGQGDRAGQIATLAVGLALIFGLLLISVLWPLAPKVVSLMGAEQDIHGPALSYFRIRLLGAPAVLITVAGFGILRGMMNMRTPMFIAGGLNLINIFFDWVLIFGVGPFPQMGLAGAALATTLSQWLGGVGCVWAVSALGCGFSTSVRPADGLRLCRIGGDLFVRTGMLNLFLLVTTRTATLMGPDTGAAHQALRQFWLFTALFLDAYAIAGQSLAGYFMGAGRAAMVRRVAKVVCIWSVGIGGLLGLVMAVGYYGVAALLVPATVAGLLKPAWMVAALFQPLNALAFGTDGLHWGTGDFKFLRNVMAVGSLGCAGAVLLLEYTGAISLVLIWWITGVWICNRAVFGILRIWPGVGNSPFSRQQV